MTLGRAGTERRSSEEGALGGASSISAPRDAANSARKSAGGSGTTGGIGLTGDAIAGLEIPAGVTGGPDCTGGANDDGGMAGVTETAAPGVGCARFAPLLGPSGVAGFAGFTLSAAVATGTRNGFGASRGGSLGIANSAAAPTGSRSISIGPRDTGTDLGGAVPTGYGGRGSACGAGVTVSRCGGRDGDEGIGRAGVPWAGAATGLGGAPAARLPRMSLNPTASRPRCAGGVTGGVTGGTTGF